MFLPQGGASAVATVGHIRGVGAGLFVYGLHSLWLRQRFEYPSVLKYPSTQVEVCYWVAKWRCATIPVNAEYNANV